MAGRSSADNQQTDRASRGEIFERLQRIVGEDAEAVVVNAVLYYKNGQYEEGLRIIVDYDRRFGEGGLAFVHDGQGRRKLGVYRPMAYVYGALASHRAIHQTREICYSTCAYLENLLKHLAKFESFRIEFEIVFGRMDPQKLHLGRLAHAARRVIGETLHEDIKWIDTSINRPAKHEYPDVEYDSDDEDRPHMFDLDEAVAIYFIGRELGKRLESIAEDKGEILSWKLSGDVD